jgi:hypothetical protein
MKVTLRYLSLPATLLSLFALACSYNPTSPSELSSGTASRSDAASGPLQSAGGAFQEDPLFACPRSPGFYCQNQNGKNPNMTADQFNQLASAAAGLLAAVPALDTPEEIRRAICNNGDQLLRHLATLALNLAAGLEPTTPLSGEAFNGQGVGTVQEAFNLAVGVANDPLASKSVRNQIKDILDRINNNENTGLTDCDDEAPAEEASGGTSGSGGTGSAGNSSKLTICHKRKNTLTIDASAWPAHQAHGDTQGPCQ